MGTHPTGRGLLAPLAAAFALAACGGSGSDVGPTLRGLPGIDWRVLVLDDAGRGVCNARVAIAGHPEVAVTGQTGRAQVLGSPTGARIVEIDGRQASATAGDRLGQMWLLAQFDGPRELPYVVYLPDSSASSVITLSDGVSGPVTLDDRAHSGALLAVDSGTRVFVGVNGPVELRCASLQAHHLPPGLPSAGGAVVASRGWYFDPPGIGFSPGATMTVPNELRLPANAVVPLFLFDPFSGSWTASGSGTVNPAATDIVATNAIRMTGLYAFTATSAATATVTGRLLDNAQHGVAGALVRAGEAVTRSGSDGRFVVGPLAALDPDGVARTVQLEVAAGRDWWPLRLQRPVALAAGPVDVGDLAFETVRTCDVAVQLILKGRADPRQPLRFGGPTTYGITVGDAEGKAVFEDQDVSEFFGGTSSRPLNVQRIYAMRGLKRLEAHQRIDTLQAFSQEQDWWSGRSRNGITSCQVHDRLATSPVWQAAVVRGTVANEGLVGHTNEFGVQAAGFGIDGQATAAFMSGVEGRTVHSAFTVVAPDTDRLELAVERARRRPLGEFVRHGAFAGQITNHGGPLKTRRIRATRQLSLQDWFESRLLHDEQYGTAPRRVDPELTGLLAYSLGVPAPEGNLAAVEGTVAGGVFALEAVGIAPRLQPPVGGVTARDVALDLAAVTSFVAPAAVRGLDPAIGAGSLRFDLGFHLADGAVIDVARGVGGNHVIGGDDVAFTLPALAGVLAQGRHLLAFGGAASAGGRTIEQLSFLALRAAPGPAVELLPVPVITSPLPGAMLPATGFSVDFTLPAAALYAVLQLRSDVAGEVREWTAVVPNGSTQFTFRALPFDASAPLRAGLTYRLRLTAFRVREPGIVNSVRPYQHVVTNWVGLREVGQGVDGVAANEFTVTLQ